MTKYLFSIILTITTNVVSSPWMPWEDSNYNKKSSLSSPWMPWDSASNPAYLSNSNWVPFNSDTNWTPISTVDDWVKDTNFSVYFKTDNALDTAKSANASVNSTGVLDNQLFGQTDADTKTRLDGYYEGLANYYNKVQGKSDYYGYKGQGYFDYMPDMGNSFPAPAYKPNKTQITNF